MTCERIYRVFGVVVAVLLLAQLGFPQQPSNEDLKKDIDALKETLKGMQKDLQDIKALLQSRMQPAPPQNVVLDLGNWSTKGVPTCSPTKRLLTPGRLMRV